MTRKIKMNRRLNFKVNPEKTKFFPLGKRGFLINKRGKKIPYKVIHDADISDYGSSLLIVNNPSPEQRRVLSKLTFEKHDDDDDI